MENQVKILREKMNMTQNELAERSGLSLRTVQRVEAGNILKGFTLKALAQALNTQPEDLIISSKEEINVQQAKKINLSALAGLIIPYGGIIFPAVLTYQTKDLKNRELGKSILCIQIIVSVVFSVLMIISPFIQKLFTFKFPLFMIPLVLFLCLKLFIVIKNGISLNKTQDLVIKLKTNFL
ncbi:XRE family transcriptional regulator [Chryseobacterium contaminans]|uniref:DNA-binding transcriptional regulator, XRE-family HTH domain n=1 Tax=Chryseobacterium contaminans TaxID=1423959 RepID=A0A1M7GZ05_9FLAO|nr:helix-turn-helix transcriptional regulator [Chryseobacterium contaminans]OCA79556.1 XRE family transcriptional regulator [Chryseobacterium contaminans]SHM21480.1 DNA-binding transcriptional regulator, XRE-family HTH domain [Chryseobacterium contaminans]